MRALGSIPLVGELAALALALMVALLGAYLLSSRQATLARAELSLIHETGVVGQRLDAQLAFADFNLDALAGVETERLLRMPASPARGRAIAALAHRPLAAMRALFLGVYDGDGALAGGGARPPQALAALGDLAFFARHRDQNMAFQLETAGDLGMAGRAVIGLSRAVTTPEGQFLGVTLAVVEVELAQDGALVGGAPGAERKILFDAAGQTLARWSAEAAGRDPADPSVAAPFATALADPTRAVPAKGGAKSGAKGWIVAVHQLSDFPLRLGSAMSEDTALASWWDEVRVVLLVLGFATVSLAGAVAGLIGQSRQRRQAEARLRDELALRTTLLDTIPLAVVYKDTALRYLGANAAYEALVGRPFAGMAGHAMGEIFEAATANFNESGDREAIASGHPVTTEQEVRLPDGRTRSLLVSKAAFHHADGTLGGVISVVVDLSERRHAEARMAALLKALEFSPAVIIITDAEARITYVNPAFTAVAGYTLEEVEGKTPNILASGQTPPETYADLWRMISQGHVWHGEFHNRRKDGETYWESAAIAPILGPDGHIVSYVAIKEDITEKKRRDERIWRQANYDALTGLANRAFLFEHLAQALEQAKSGSGRIAVLFLDLDHFKPVNDQFGHEVGDELLAVVAQRLRTATRESDLVARLGGDEFAVVMGMRENSAGGMGAGGMGAGGMGAGGMGAGGMGAGGMGEVAMVARRILGALAEPYALSVGEVNLSATIGVSRFPDDGLDAESLLRRADAAMYVAKQEGRATSRFWSETVPQPVAGTRPLVSG